MRRLGLLNILVLVLLVGLGVLFVTADRRERAVIDLQRPSTLLTFVGNRLHDLTRTRIDSGTAVFRETVRQHEAPKKALER